MNAKKSFEVTITDADMECHVYYFMAANLWLVSNYIQALMVTEGDFYGHKQVDTTEYGISELEGEPLGKPHFIIIN